MHSMLATIQTLNIHRTFEICHLKQCTKKPVNFVEDVVQIICRKSWSLQLVKETKSRIKQVDRPWHGARYVVVKYARIDNYSNDRNWGGEMRAGAE